MYVSSSEFSTFNENVYHYPIFKKIYIYTLWVVILLVFINKKEKEIYLKIQTKQKELN